MAGSGLIYAAIVAAWVAYLVPTWVRRGEGRTHRDRSTDRMRILRRGRRRLTGGHAELDALDLGAPARRVRTSVSPRTARRRRRSIALLLIALVGTTIGASAGGVPAWVPPLVVLALFGYLLMLRRSVQRMVLERRRALARRAVREVAEASAAQVSAGRHVSVRVDVVSLTEPVAPAVRIVAPVPAARAEEPAAADGTWQPHAVPLPTYVTAPKATRSIRTIDLSAPGAWTSGRLEDSPALPTVRTDEPSRLPVPEAGSQAGLEADVGADVEADVEADVGADFEADFGIEHRRAVGG